MNEGALQPKSPYETERFFKNNQQLAKLWQEYSDTGFNFDSFFWATRIHQCI